MNSNNDANSIVILTTMMLNSIVILTLVVITQKRSLKEQLGSLRSVPPVLMVFRPCDARQGDFQFLVYGLGVGGSRGWGFGVWGLGLRGVW